MQALQAKASSRAVLPARSGGSRRVAVCASPQDEIYIGFVKEEGFGDRTGRKGRFIKDDPSKYPAKDDMGLLLGVTGGWAGGEAGLWKLLDEYANSGVKGKKPAPQNMIRGPPKAGKDPVYLGFGKEKEDFDARNAGAKGRVIYDDGYKYPAKDDIGPLLGATGGFAGGEAGLKQFVNAGTAFVRRPGTPGPKQFSPLTIAGYMVLAGLIAGVALAVAGVN